jgi:hypothetical protein
MFAFPITEEEPMSKTSAFIEPGFNSGRQREQERIEAKSPVNQFTQSQESVRLDVELAREWAVLGGD